jgi:hypothetical protein
MLEEKMLKTAVCPKGNVFTHADLPPRGWNRWTPHRKQMIVSAVTVGMISLEDVTTRYGVSGDEFSHWLKLSRQHGVKGLRTQRLQEYRA